MRLNHESLSSNVYSSESQGKYNTMASGRKGAALGVRSQDYAYTVRKGEVP